MDHGTADQDTLDANSLTDAMMSNFMKMMKPGKSSRKLGCLVIDIKLIAKADFYTMEITHCGIWTEKGFKDLFDDFFTLVKNKGLLNDKAILAYVFRRNNGEEDETVYEILGRENLRCNKITKNNKFIHFPSFKNYLLIKLQYKLSSQDLSEFKEIMIKELKQFKKSNRDVKITFYIENEVFYSNKVESDDDFHDCYSLSLPLISVIKQSTNNQFKERCLKTLGVDNVHNAQKDLARKLFSMIHENYMLP